MHAAGFEPAIPASERPQICAFDGVATGNVLLEINYKILAFLKPFYYQLMHTMLKNTESLKHSKITLQHVSVYAETIFRELQSVLG